MLAINIISNVILHAVNCYKLLTRWSASVFKCGYVEQVAKYLKEARLANESKFQLIIKIS